jgi:D-inositol-3-phosphate glycosyltransferase
LGFLVQDGITGFTVPDGDADRLYARLSLLLRDEALRKKMGQAATAYARDFSWDRITRQVHAVYRELVTIKEP